MAKAGSAAAMASRPPDLRAGLNVWFPSVVLGRRGRDRGLGRSRQGGDSVTEVLAARIAAPAPQLPGRQPANGSRGGFSAPLRVPRTGAASTPRKRREPRIQSSSYRRKFASRRTPDFEWDLLGLDWRYYVSSIWERRKPKSTVFNRGLYASPSSQTAPLCVNLSRTCRTIFRNLSRAFGSGRNSRPSRTVVHVIGFAGAILACILTTLTSVCPTRTSRRAIGYSAVAAGGGEESKRGRVVCRGSGPRRQPLAGLGAVLLILPGFVSDFVGLALAAPSVDFGLPERLKWQVWDGWGMAAPAAPQNHLELARRGEWSFAARWAVALKGFAPQEAAASSLRSPWPPRRDGARLGLRSNKETRQRKQSET